MTYDNIIALNKLEFVWDVRTCNYVQCPGIIKYCFSGSSTSASSGSWTGEERDDGRYDSNSTTKETS